MYCLKAQRISIRRVFTRAINELKEEQSKGAEVDKNVISILWKRTEDRFNQLNKIDEEILQELRTEDTSQEELDEEYESIQEYRDKWNDVNAPNYDELVPVPDHVPDARSISVRSDNESRTRYKLPKLKLMEFSGSPREWLNFWSQFKGIHEDLNLSEEEKFQYLIQATGIESVARRVVTSFPPTRENYNKAIEHLKSRFGKEKVLVEMYVRDLLKLVLTNTNGRQKLQLSTLYDKLETQLRALESLGVTTDKYAAMLYPLVESSLSEDILVAWERIRNQIGTTGNNEGNEDQLKQLMEFLRGEVESNVRLKMAQHGIISDEEDSYVPPRKQQKIVFETVTTSDLFNEEKPEKCLFCGKFHLSQGCTNIQKLTLKDKFTKVREAGKCFRCLKGNHFARTCRSSVKCQLCGNNHYKLLCNKDNNDKTTSRKINNFSTYSGFNEIIYQTLIVMLNGPKESKCIRALIDSASGRSYITTQAVKNFGFDSVGTVELAHSLFGGNVTSPKKHTVYNIDVSNINKTFQRNCQLLEVEKICGSIGSTPRGRWLEELAKENIQLSDCNQEQYQIHVLFGADIASKLYTGKIFETKQGPVAFETKYGWTLMGTTENNKFVSTSNSILLVHSLYVNTANIHDLWNLDIIGIHDPAEDKSKEELTKSALIHFEENIRRLENGRYEVALPWIEGHQPVAKNQEVAEKRLQSSLSKLQRLGKLESYQKIFDEWITMGIIEEVEKDEYNQQNVSYLPHHPVFNEKSKTTPIRPVFDASTKSKGSPSLNDCLEKGQNLLQEIPALLILFKMKRFAAISDVKKAFLQIGVKQEDRDYLRFLWYDKDGNIIILRHCRVVFGISSSPFLLAATVNHHLDKVRPEYQDTAKLLKKSIYVDNCVTSVDTDLERKKFIEESTEVCAQAKFELRGWVWNRGEVIARDVPGVGSPECGLGAGSEISQETSIVSVLGLLWNFQEDTLSLDLRNIINHDDKVITKRNILAATHQIYDPLGYTAPSTIIPKMLLQEICKKKKKWDEAVPEDIAKRYVAWRNSLTFLAKLKVPRWVGSTNFSKRSIHIFTDASKKAYAAVAFIRIAIENIIYVHLLLAKSRVATIRPITIPKLELVACECGAKMANYLRNTIDMTDTKLYLWSDSGNALSWIKREENWQIFVHNRVKKINELTKPEEWLHIPGNLNPADLPSRGCSNKRLLEEKWWEGPDWLKKEKQFWPKSEINCDEVIVMAEKKKVVISHIAQEVETNRYLRYFSNLRKVVRMIAWMRRWKTYKRGEPRRKELSLVEEQEAENCLWRMVQQESFGNSKKLSTQLNAEKDEFGLWRVKTKLLMRLDTEGFRRPILLPKEHLAVFRLVQKEHLDMHHCDNQVLRSTLRERFWIIGARIITRQVVTGCKRCIRFKAKNLTTPVAPLPSNRVRDAAVFEVTGIDLGGPLYLLDEKKAWFVIFTCAVYRAVHLELVSSLSTEGFIQALRRFIARRGRPEVIYSDNGTNFEGTENLMEKINWEEIVAHTAARRIKWIFNPPSAPWWGGWWERIVAMIKQLLRRNLGRGVLDYEEMSTVLCDCEQLLNLRPLTYLSEDPEELREITPMMFLNEARSSEVIDLDKIESNAFRGKFKHRQEIRQELRERFRKEYLSLLVHRNIRNTGHTNIKVGDVVIMEVENKKRVNWPLARVTQTFPGSDGIVRSVKVKVVKGEKQAEFERPIQRLYMLESSTEDIKDITLPIKMTEQENKVEEKPCEHKKKGEEKKITRSGRTVHHPKRFGF